MGEEPQRFFSLQSDQVGRFFFPSPPFYFFELPSGFPQRVLAEFKVSDWDWFLFLLQDIYVAKNGFPPFTPFFPFSKWWLPGPCFPCCAQKGDDEPIFLSKKKEVGFLLFLLSRPHRGSTSPLTSAGGHDRKRSRFPPKIFRFAGSLLPPSPPQLESESLIAFVSEGVFWVLFHDSEAILFPFPVLSVLRRDSARYPVHRSPFGHTREDHPPFSPAAPWTATLFHNVEFRNRRFCSVLF